MRFGASRFVAGETLDECVAVLRRLNDQGLYANTTLLGEGVLEPGETAGVVRAYREIIDRIADERLRANVALKLTHLGLDVDEELALRNVRELVERATERDGFVRIDMEQSSYVDADAPIYRRLREAGLTRVGTVLQAYLYRTPDDLAALLPLEPNLRLVKGAYLEPHDIAYAHKVRRRRRLRPPDGAYAGRGRAHGDRDARRAVDRARDPVRDRARDRT